MTKDMSSICSCKEFAQSKNCNNLVKGHLPDSQEIKTTTSHTKHMNKIYMHQMPVMGLKCTTLLLADVLLHAISQLGLTCLKYDIAAFFPKNILGLH